MRTSSIPDRLGFTKQHRNKTKQQITASRSKWIAPALITFMRLFVLIPKSLTMFADGSWRISRLFSIGLHAERTNPMNFYTDRRSSLGYPQCTTDQQDSCPSCTHHNGAIQLKILLFEQTQLYGYCCFGIIFTKWFYSL